MAPVIVLQGMRGSCCMAPLLDASHGCAELAWLVLLLFGHVLRAYWRTGYINTQLHIIRLCPSKALRVLGVGTAVVGISTVLRVSAVSFAV